MGGGEVLRWVLRSWWVWVGEGVSRPVREGEECSEGISPAAEEGVESIPPKGGGGGSGEEKGRKG